MSNKREIQSFLAMASAFASPFMTSRRRKKYSADYERPVVDRELSQLVQKQQTEKNKELRKKKAKRKALRKRRNK